MRMIKSIVLLFAIAATMATVSANVRVNGKMAKDSKFKVADLPSVGAQVINTFFTVALDSLTSSSDGFEPIINPQTSFIQISSTGIPVDPSVFNSTTAFSNPSPTDLVQAEHFVELVNHNQVVSNIESAYWDILKSAAALPNTDTSTLRSYTDACNYLWTDGVNKTHKSPVFVQYGTLKTAYATALATFRLKQATLSASDWYINSPIYQAALSNAQEDFQAVAPQVESALNTIATTGASLSATVFADAQSLFRSTAIASVIRGEAFSVVDGNPSFHVVFAQPPDWAINAAEYTSISISASNFATSTSSSYTSWSTGGSSFFGFFSWGANGNTKTDLYTAEATDITLNLDYILVELDRPWLDDSLFGVSQWKIPGEAIGSVSNGRPNQSSGRLPSYTTHLVVVKNLNIVASWTQRDTSYISRHVSGGGRLGFGCFSIAGGNYQSGSSQNTQTAQFANSVLSAPGAQIIGYVQKIVPNSPPLRG